MRFIVMSFVLSWWRLLKTMKFANCLQLTHEWTTRERSHEKPMLEAEEWSVRLYFASHFATWLTYEWSAKFSTWMILSVTLIPFTCTIYIFITHKIVRRLFRKKEKKKRGFYNTPTLLERAIHSQERNLCSSFSSPLPLLYLERRFVPKHNPHIFRV